MAGNGSAPSEPHGPPAALKPAGCSQSTEAGPQWVSPAPSLHLLHSTLGGADFAQGPTFPFSLGLQSWRSSLSFGFPVLAQPSLICISAFPSLVQAGGVGRGESSFPEWLMQVLTFSSPSPLPPPLPTSQTGKSCQWELCRHPSPSACNFTVPISHPVSSEATRSPGPGPGCALLLFSSSPHFSSLAPCTSLALLLELSPQP